MNTHPTSEEDMKLEASLELRSRLTSALRGEGEEKQPPGNSHSEHLPLLLEALDVCQQQGRRTTLCGWLPRGYSWIQVPNLLFGQDGKVLEMPFLYRGLFFLLFIATLFSGVGALIGIGWILTGESGGWLLMGILAVVWTSWVGMDYFVPALSGPWNPDGKFDEKTVVKGVASKVERELVKAGIMSERDIREIDSHPRVEETIRYLKQMSQPQIDGFDDPKAANG